MRISDWSSDVCSSYLHYGDSMSPRYQNGDIIAVRQVRNLDVILWGEAYLVITDEATNGLKVLRLLMEHENKDKVILRALNPDFSRSEEHTSELQSLMRISYAVFCLKKKNKTRTIMEMH